MSNDTLRWREAGILEPRPKSAISARKGRARVWRWLERKENGKWVPVRLEES